jgi:hypothetical protein
MAQLRFGVHRALPVLEASIDGPAVVDDIARLAVSGRPGTDVVQVTGPRHHRRDQPRRPRIRRLQHLPATERGALLHPGHLDTQAAVEQTGLNAEQRDARLQRNPALWLR